MKVLKQNRSKTMRELVQAGKRHKAVELYAQGKVSLGLAAHLSEVSLSEFLDMLKEHNAHLNISKEDVQDALSTARKVW